MCWISLTISDNAHSQKEDAGHNQSLCCHDEVCVLFWSSHWTVWMFLPLGFIYNTAWKGATCWPAACHVDLWKAICMTLRVNCMASFTQQSWFSQGGLWEFRMETCITCTFSNIYQHKVLFCFWNYLFDFHPIEVFHLFQIFRPFKLSLILTKLK